MTIMSQPKMFKQPHATVYPQEEAQLHVIRKCSQVNRLYTEEKMETIE